MPKDFDFESIVYTPGCVCGDKVEDDAGSCNCSGGEEHLDFVKLLKALKFLNSGLNKAHKRIRDLEKKLESDKSQ